MRKSALRIVQLLALVVIWHGSAAAAEASACSDFGQCMPSCTNPQGYCDNGPPHCEHEGRCSGLPCPDLPDGSPQHHIYCMLTPH